MSRGKRIEPGSIPRYTRNHGLMASPPPLPDHAISTSPGDRSMLRHVKVLAVLIASVFGFAFAAQGATRCPQAYHRTCPRRIRRFLKLERRDRALQQDGYKVVAAANPLRSVEGDAKYVAAILYSIKGPVVLVGHSYGGVVISSAAYGFKNVKALVFVSALIPEAGETGIGLSNKFPGSTLAEHWLRLWHWLTADRISTSFRTSSRPSSRPMSHGIKHS